MAGLETVMLRRDFLKSLLALPAAGLGWLAVKPVRYSPPMVTPSLTDKSYWWRYDTNSITQIVDPSVSKSWKSRYREPVSVTLPTKGIRVSRELYEDDLNDAKQLADAAVESRRLLEESMLENAFTR